MHDARGKALKVGDLVLIPAVVTTVQAFDDFCNVTVTSQIGRRPDGMKETIHAINTGVLVKISSSDD